MFSKCSYNTLIYSSYERRVYLVSDTRCKQRASQNRRLIDDKESRCLSRHLPRARRIVE